MAAVAYNRPTLCAAPEILIQAKRYSKCVPSQRSPRFWPAPVEEKRATSGIQLQPHGSGPRPRPFAAGNNRLRIIEGGELKHLLEEYLHIDVRIDLARRAHKWPF
jgi:restriction system protein